MCTLPTCRGLRKAPCGSAIGFAALALLGVFLLGHPASGQNHRASLTGQVVSTATDQPLRAARVFLAGTGLSAVTGEDGRFTLENVPAGIHFLQVAFLGTATEQLPIRLPASGRKEVRVLLDVRVVPLPALEVSLEPERRGKLAGFYERAEKEMGYFFTREDIERIRPRETTDLLRRVPGLQVDRRAPTRQAVSRVRGRPCNIRYFLDGMHVPGFDVDGVPPKDIDGIEVYRGGAEIPPRFRRFTTCAAIVIWTREPGK